LGPPVGDLAADRHTTEAMAVKLMEPMDRSFWRAVSAEFFATFLFVFLGLGCALSSMSYEGISLCFGLNIFVLAHTFGHVSGAHFNPAVTLALVITRLVTPLRGALYALSQFLAALLASAVLMGVMGLTPDTMGGYNALNGPTGMSHDTKVARGFVFEMMLTCLLLLTVFATIDPKHGKESPGALAIGMAVGVAHFVAVPMTGCGINPARSFGPAMLANAPAAKGDLWVFILAPFIGATLATVYPLWFAEEDLGGNLRSKFSSDNEVKVISSSEHLA